jgi:hypothetical protein
VGGIRLLGSPSRSGGDLVSSHHKLRVGVMFGWRKNEKDMAEWVKKALESNKDEIEVRDAEMPESKDVIEKISDVIDWADEVFCVFSKRYYVGPKGKKTWITSPYVVSEGAFALGRYYRVKGDKNVHLVLEEGLDENASLGILRDLKKDQIKINLKDYKGSLLRLETYVQQLLKDTEDIVSKSYAQKYLNKDVYVLENGNAVFRNIIKILILDEDEFEIVNHILFSRKRFDVLEKIIKREVDYTGNHQYFKANVVAKNDVPISSGDTLITVAQGMELQDDLAMQLKFPDLDYRNLDEITYQYIWAMPSLYKHDSTSKDNSHEVLLKTSYGKLDFINFAVHFEKNYKFEKSSSPHVQEALDDVSSNPSLSGGKRLNYRDDVLLDTYYMDKSQGYLGTIRAFWKSAPLA